MDLKKKREERGQLVTKMTSLRDTVKKRGDDYTEDENRDFEKWNTAVDAIDAEIEKEERKLQISARVDSLLADDETRSDRRKRPPVGAPSEDEDDEREAPDALTAARSTKQYVKAYARHLIHGGFRMESRADLQVDNFTKGGALLAPIQMVNGLLKGVDDEVYIRALATKYQIAEAQSLGQVTLDTDFDDAEWGSEIGDINMGDLTVGRRELSPHVLTKGIVMSNDLLRRKPGAENDVISRLGYKFGITQEKAFMTGNGVRQPLGVFVASADGIDSSRDVSTGNTSTAITGDGLIEAKHALKAAYWKRVRWGFSRTAIKNIRQIKDSVNGGYIWMPGLQAGMPDKILDCEYFISEYCPATFTSGLYVGIIGDFSYYWIADALDFTIQRVDQLYAKQRKTAFFGSLACDGQPVLAEAFARVKLG